jgi:hypothetical protein
MSEISMEMPRYKCHKKVWALEIKSIEPLEGFARIYFVDTRYAPMQVTNGYVAKHNPQPGGYYVVYKDGYKSYSPAKAFEEGYHLDTTEKCSDKADL